MSFPGGVQDETTVHNRESWLSFVGIAIDDATRVSVTYGQPDYYRYSTLSAASKGMGMRDNDIIISDALVVTKPGHALFLPVADCVATVLYDEEKSILMLSHLGRHSLEQDGGVKSVQYLVDTFGVNPENLKVWLSPTLNKEVYPIFALGNKGMKEVLYDQLAVAGVDSVNITDNTADTFTDPEYYSHSAYLQGNQEEDGRFAMVTMMVQD